MIFLLQVSSQITEPPKSQSVTEEYPVNLSCVASGIPTPTFVWTFNNGDLPPGINQTDHEGESFVVLLSVTKWMNGTYKCTEKNKANTTSSSATLRVYGKFSYNDIDKDNVVTTTTMTLIMTMIMLKMKNRNRERRNSDRKMNL